MIISRRNLLALSCLAPLGGAGCSLVWPAEPPVLPGDRLVFLVHTGGGFAPNLTLALIAPELAMYGDGRVIVAAEWKRPNVPRRYVEYRAGPDAVARFAARAEDTGLVLEQVEYGTPQVTDLGGTRVLLNGAGGSHEVSVYALSSRFDTHVDLSERRRRRRLRDLIGEAEALGSGESAASYLPDRVVVLERGSDEVTVGAVPAWPGPDPDTFMHSAARVGSPAGRCGELTGRQAAAVYKAALNNEGQVWRVGDRNRVLAVNPLPIGLDC